MKHRHSLGTRVLAMVLCVMLVLGLLPPGEVRAENGMVAQVGDIQYPTLAEAFEAAAGGAQTTITLLENTSYSFNVGNSTGTAPQSLVLDLNGKKLTLIEAVGSDGTKSNGIRVLANSALTIRNGELLCSSETADNIKVGIANYGTLVLDSVKLYPGALTMYGVNNRGKLTLKGQTAIYDGDGEKFQAAVTNDPYNYIYSDFDAVFNVADSSVLVESVLVERYERSTANVGGVVFNVSGGTFGKITEDGASAVPVSYNVSGALIQVATAEQLHLAVDMASAEGTPVTVKLTQNIDTSFNVGNSTGTAPKNLVLDLNGNTLNLIEAVGSDGTKSSGIRVLANSAMTIRNGEIRCSSETADNIKVGIANYGTLVLDGVKLYPGALTMYGVNNRGNLTLKGQTAIYNGDGEKFQAAVTNDPYDYIYTDFDAVFNVTDNDVLVESVLVERYERSTTNAGGVELNISGGTFGKITEDGASAIPVSYNVSGAVIEVATAEQLHLAVDMASAEGTPITVKLTQNIDTSFNVGNSTGTAPKNLVLDLNGNTLNLIEAVGSDGTKSSGIRVLANSAMTIRNGEIRCSSETADNIKVGIANYGTLELDGVKLYPGALTMYGVNNRGKLTLKGQTAIYNGSGEKFQAAITNDPYDYIYSDFTAELNCDDDQVLVESILVERYPRTTTNAAGVALNISAGTFGTLTDDGQTDRPAAYRITGGSFANEINEFLDQEDYECIEQDGRYVVTFIKKEQTGFGFAQAGPVELTYTEGLTFENAAAGGSVADGEIIYTIVEEGSTPGAATVDANGLVTILKAGTVIIEASKAGDATYLDAVARYELKIAPKEREIAFGTAFVDVIYGTRTYTNDTLSISAQSNGTKVAYSIVSGGEIATINSETGELTFADQAVGTVVVKAAVYGDDCYADGEATYKVAVDWLTQSADMRWTVSGDTGSNGWYKSKVTLTAPAGCTIGTSNSMDSEDWAETKTFDAEGLTELDLYLKNEQGHITAAIPFSVKIDKTAPGVAIEYVEEGNASLFKWLGSMIFGSNDQAKIVFHVTGDDIALVEWSKDNGHTFEQLQAENGVYSVTIKPEYRGHIAVRVTDIAGWTVQNEDDGPLVLVDKITPQLSANIREGQNSGSVSEFPRDNEDFINSSAEEFFLDFEFADNNFDLTTITLTIERTNGADQENVELQWTPAEDGTSATATLALTERDEYVITANFQDPVNKGSRIYKIRLFNSEPELRAEPVSGQSSKPLDGVDYYKSEDGVKVQLSVTDDFFAKCESGVIVNGEHQVIAPEDWKRNEETGAYTTVLTYTEEGAYEVQAFYNNTWNGEKTSEAYRFVLDRTAPTVTGLQYKEISGWEEFFGKLFGFHNGDLTAEVVGAEDSLAGISKVEFSLDGGETFAEVAASEDGYVFAVAADYRGQITLKITDNAGNVKTYGESRIVVLDTQEPKIERIEYLGNSTMESDPLVDASSSDDNFSVVFTIAEDNLDVAPEQPKVYFKRLNTVEEWQEANVTYSNDNRTVQFAMTIGNGITDGKYQVKVVVQDHFSTVEKQVIVKIDRTAPTIATELQGSSNTPDEHGITYHNQNVNLSIVITEDNFKSGNVNVTVKYNNVEDPTRAEFAKKDGNWLKVGSVNKLAIPFEDEGVYEVTISCTDSLGTSAQTNANGSHEVVHKFVIDRTAPDASFEYNEDPSWIETLKGLFGFREETITVNLNAADPLAGVASVQISTDGENFEDAQRSGEKYVFTVEERYQGQLTLLVVDKAGNETKVLEAHALVVDKDDPNFDVTMDYSSYVKHEGNDNLYTNKKPDAPFEFWLEVKDEDTYDLFAGQAVVNDNGVPMEDLVWENTDDTAGKVLIQLPDEGRHELTATIKTGLYTAEWAQTVIVDTTAPVINIDFFGTTVQTANGFDYYDEGQTVTITIDEVNFKAEMVLLQMEATKVALDEDGNPVELPDYAAIARDPANWTTDEGTNVRRLVLDVPTDAVYNLKVNYTDLATNPAEEKTASFVVDTAIPTVDTVTYSKDAVEVLLEEITFGFFQADVNVQVEASDHTAGVQYVDYWVEGTVSKNDPTEVKLNGTLTADENGKVETFSLPAAFYGKVYTQARDYSGNTSTKTNVAADLDNDGQLIEHVVVDADAPVLGVTSDPVRVHEGVEYFNQEAVLELTVEESNFYEDLFTTTVTTEGADYTVSAWNTNGTTHKQTVTMRSDADYVVTVTGKDHSGNEMTSHTTPTMVVDTTAPVIDVKLYGTDDEGKFLMDKVAEGEIYENDPVTYFGTAIKAVITVVEHNFYAEEAQWTIEGVDPLGNALTFTMDPANWTHDGDTHVYEVCFLVDGTYKLDVAYTDLANNPGNDVAELNFDVDNANPDIVVEGIVDGSFNKDGQTVTVKITDANFAPDEAHLSYTITAKDSANEDVMAEGVKLAETFPDLHNIDNWTKTIVEGKVQWSTVLDFAAEANYTIELSYTDRSGRVGYVHDSDPKEPLTVYSAAFTVDNTTPKEMDIVYGAPKGTSDDGVSIFYYQDSATLALKAKDDIAGLDYYVLDVTQEGLSAATTIVLPANADQIRQVGALKGFEVVSIYNENGEMTVDLKVPANFNGKISFRAYDKAGNQMDYAAEKSIVVDNVAPVLVAETAPTQILDASQKTVAELPEGVTNAAYLKNVDLYYADKAEYTFTLTEANFLMGDVVFTVNGEAAELVWTAEEDSPEYKATWTSAVDGDYVLSLSYQDRSRNEKVTYTSPRIVVDTKAPVMKVEFSEVAPTKVTENRDYYNAVRYATITIVDENFRAEDVQITAAALNVTGDPVGNLTAEYVNRGKTQNAGSADDAQKWSAFNDEAKWRRVDDTYTIVIPFTTDANYTFAVTYKDLVLKEAEAFTAKDFTVDTTVPENLTMTYSVNPLDQIIEDITFGFYNAQLQVTITAEDETSGIDHFNYSYINREGVSSVNAELRNQDLAVAKYEGRKATATFTIPQAALGRNNQFNGTVQFDAYDRSTNKSHEDGVMGVIVDNISPTASVTFNDPVQTVNGTEYYNGAITGRIVITEANFFSSDVQVVITRDGARYDQRVSWRDNSVDEHVGTFTLDQEGDYVITINYTDKSNNKMAEYRSATKVIDLAKPVISVSNVVADSANDDEVYTFTITVDDADGNLRAEDIKPLLSGVFRNADGTHTAKEIDLGDAVVVAAGKTFTYTVQDLPDDGIYTLTCSAADLARNSTKAMVLDDATAPEEIQFSINRNGSTFTYGDDATRILAENYFVQSVGHDLIIHEVNVDPINNYTVTLNGEKLTEGKDYTTTLSGGNNKWSLREYVIKADKFAAEGEYSVVVSSVDATNNTAYSDMRNLNMSFVVDASEPDIIIGGLKDEGRYQNEGQIVTMYPSDEGGSLHSVRVELYDTNATPGVDEPKAILFEMADEELHAYLLANGGKIEFKVPEGYRQQVQIVCTDYAVDADGNVNTYTQTLKDITVSPSGFMMFYANKPVFYGTLSVLALILAIIIFLIARKKSKKEKTAA